MLKDDELRHLKSDQIKMDDVLKKFKELNNFKSPK